MFLFDAITQSDVPRGTVKLPAFHAIASGRLLNPFASASPTEGSRPDDAAMCP